MVATTTLEPQVVEAPTRSMQLYTQDALPGILTMLQQTLGNSGAVRKTEEFWIWKHHRNPFGPSYGLYVWDDAVGEVAALRVLMRWSLYDKGGRSRQAVRAVDTATHPNHQRHGLFTSLTRQAILDLTDQGVDLIYNTPNQKSLPGYLKMGWQVAARWPLYIKPLRPDRMALRRLRPVAAEVVGNFTRNFGPAILPWHSFLFEYGEQIEALIQSWEGNRLQTGLRTRRSLDYFDWRYGGHPHIQYAVYPYLNKQGKLYGFAILRPNVRFGWQESILTELCLAAPYLENGTHLLRALSRQLRGDYLIAHFAQNTLEAKLLKRGGFWRVPREEIIFTVRPLQASADELLQEEAWDLTLGDLELF